MKHTLIHLYINHQGKWKSGEYIWRYTAHQAEKYKNKEKIALKYDPIKRAENHKIAKQNAINKRKKQYENQVYSKKSVEKLKENAIEKHLAFKKKTRKRFKDININLSKTLTWKVFQIVWRTDEEYWKSMGWH